MPSALSALLIAVKDEYFGGNQQRLADAIGVTSSRLTRVIRRGEGALDVLPCLQLAKVSNRSASEILRAAGRDDVDTLLLGLYGQPTPTLDAPQRNILRRWTGLSDVEREHFEWLLDHLPKAVAARRGATAPPTSGRDAAPKGKARRTRGRTPRAAGKHAGEK